MHEGCEGVEDADLHVAALEPDRVGEAVAVDRGADDRAVDEPDVDLRQAGLPGDRALGLLERLALDGVDELHELGVVDRRLGRLRSWVRVVVKPLTSSPAIPITTWVGRKPPSPRPPGARPRSCPRRPRCPPPSPTACGSGPGAPADAADRAMPGLVDLERERLANSVPMSRAVAAAGRGRRPGSDPAQESHPACLAAPAAAGSRGAARAAAAARTAAIASPSPSRRVPSPWAISGRPPPWPSMLRTASETSGPASMPRPTRSSLTVTNSCGSSASSPTAITPDGGDPRMSFARPLRARRWTRRHRPADEGDPGAISSASRGELARLRAARPRPGLEPLLRRAQLVLEGRNPLLERIRDSRRGPPPPGRGPRTLDRAAAAVGANAGGARGADRRAPGRAPHTKRRVRRGRGPPGQARRPRRDRGRRSRPGSLRRLVGSTSRPWTSSRASPRTCAAPSRRA